MGDLFLGARDVGHRLNRCPSLLGASTSGTARSDNLPASSRGC
jgi:hypothetical protein